MSNSKDPILDIKFKFKHFNCSIKKAGSHWEDGVFFLGEQDSYENCIPITKEEMEILAIAILDAIRK